MKIAHLGPQAALIALLAAGPSFAPARAATEPASIELAAEAQGNAANDLARATVFAEAADGHLAPLARKLNPVTAAALATVKAAAAVKLKSSNTRTYPVYGRDAGRIESWRMRSEIVLESRELAALSALVGKLQEAGLGLAQFEFTPSPPTRKSVEDQLIVEAIAAFKARAEVAAHALGQHYRIRRLAINTQSSAPRPYPLMRAAMANSVSGAAPVEAGESALTVSVSGTVDLIP